MKQCPTPKPLDIVHIAKALSRMLGDRAGPMLSYLAEKATPVIKDFPHRKLLQFVNIIMNANIDAQELFRAAATFLAANIRELPPGSMANMVKNYSSLGLQHQPLFDSVAEVFPSHLKTCNARDVADVAWAYWS